MALNRVMHVLHREQISSRAVANNIGVSMTDMRLMLSPDCDFHISVLRKIAEYVDVPVAELIEDVESNDTIRLRGILLKIFKIVNTLEPKIPEAQTQWTKSIRSLILDEAPEFDKLECKTVKKTGRLRGFKDLGACVLNEISTKDLFSRSNIVEREVLEGMF